jgi:hypothetical protein
VVIWEITGCIEPNFFVFVCCLLKSKVRNVALHAKLNSSGTAGKQTKTKKLKLDKKNTASL